MTDDERRFFKLDEGAQDFYNFSSGEEFESVKLKEFKIECLQTAENRPAEQAESPAATATAVATAPAADASAPLVTHTGHANIMLVDEELSLRLLTKRLLQECGHRTIEVDAADQAVRIAPRAKVDLIVMEDKQLEADDTDGMDGVEACAALKANPRTANIPVMLISSHVKKDRVLAAMQAGAKAYLVKPYDKNLFLAKVKELLGI